jgi:nitrite reductase/ring-hydroxylating ferredoxin subunit
MSVTVSPDASRGLWRSYHARDLKGWSGMTDRVVDAVVAAISTLKGETAAAELRHRGLDRLHEFIDVSEVSLVRDQVLTSLRQPLLEMATAIGRQVLGWQHDFFVDDYLILRINFPYEAARRSNPKAENPGVGRLSESVRSVFQARKVIDPVYDPKTYHRDHPPAAWAHGPHMDSWAGHSRDGRNIWWAIGEVPADAGMVLYPELAGEALPCEPRTLYLRAGYPLPAPTGLPLKAGEMLIFDPEVLHGTHLNTSGSTRVAVSMRLNASRPTFDPSCFYAREFWRRSSDIERGHDEVLHLRREDNLGPACDPVPVSRRTGLPVIDGVVESGTSTVVVDLRNVPDSVSRLVVTGGPHRVMLARTVAGWNAFDTACPHYGLDLADGGADQDKVYCPGCAVGFDKVTGRSACASLTLRSYPVIEVPSGLRIRVDA